MPLPRVGFVCIGNACRSQMAEGFARALGEGVFETHSAGLDPALSVPLQTVRTMAERGINLVEPFPKALRAYPKDYFDLVINMSGFAIDDRPNVRTWTVHDPIGGSDKVYREVRDQIEALVRQLVEELRNAPLPPRV